MDIEQEKSKNDDFYTTIPRPEYQLASIGERFIALAIDTLIIGIITSLIGVRGSEWALGNIAVHLIYHWFFLTQQNGQTPGKMLKGIRVIKTSGEPLNATDAILRYFGYLLNSLVLHIGWLWAIFDGKNQGWHDKIVSTYVVKVPHDESRKAKNEDNIVYV